MMVSPAAGGGGGSLPVAGAVLWLKPGATELFTDEFGTTPVASDGDPIKFWKDSSGNGFHGFNSVQAATYRPGVTYRGKPVTSFENAQALVIPSGFMTAMRAAGEGEMFVVIRNRAGNTAASRGLHSFADTGQDNLYAHSNGLIYEGFGSNTRKDTINPGQDLSDAFSVYDVWTKTNDYGVVLDTVSLYTSASNTVAFPSGAQHFAHSGPTLDAYVQELVVFPFKLSSGDRTLMNTYLTT